jgi:hypothetical protein
MNWLKSQTRPLLWGLFLALPLYLKWLWEVTR